MSEARSVLGVICSFYDSFFEAEKKIADYIMEHKAQAVDMTVGELARASGTSEPKAGFGQRGAQGRTGQPEGDK